MTISIREAIPQDVEAVIAVWQQCDLTRPWNDPKSDFQLASASSAATILLAEKGVALVGTIMTGFDGHRGWIYYLGTLPNHREHGIATQLVGAAAEWLKDRHCPKVELMVRRGNAAASFYEKIGWKKQDVDVYARWLSDEDK
jgi:ribosomal protein S18 acetylase RimI-like enzyme